MDVATMRRLVTAAYPGSGWARKVEKMPDDQIIALYYKFLAQKKIK